MNTRFVPKIEKPCPANWNEMQGDEKRRFCEHCQLQVHHLSAMTLTEQRDVVGSTDAHVCIRYSLPLAAVPVTGEDWMRHQTSPWWKRVAMAAMAGFATLFVIQCSRPSGHGALMGEIAAPPKVSPTDKKIGDSTQQPGPFVLGRRAPLSNRAKQNQ